MGVLFLGVFRWCAELSAYIYNLLIAATVLAHYVGVAGEMFPLCLDEISSNFFSFPSVVDNALLPVCA